MSYLARLKQLDAEKKSLHTPGNEPTKPTEPPFDGFDGSIPGANENIYIENEVAETEALLAYRHWRVHFADREPVEVYCNPDATHAEILERYPDAPAAEPIPERTGRKATPEQEAELGALVASVGAAYSFTHDEQQEALALALSDPAAALQSYRAMSDEVNRTFKPTPADDRIEKVIGKLQADPGLRYAMETHSDAEPEAVILTLAIRNKGACELRIPKSRYDAFALLELIEKHTTLETLQ